MCTLAPPRFAATPPPSQGGGGSRGDTQQARRSSTPPPVRFSFLLSAPPPFLGSMAPGEACCRSSPPAPLLPPTGVVGRACTLAGDQHFTWLLSRLQPCTLLGQRCERWHTRQTSAVSRQDFLTLYDRCSNSGLRTRLILRHQAGGHEISIFCRMSAPPSDANVPSDVRRCRHQCKHAPAAAASSPAPPTYPTASSPPPSTPHEAPPPAETTSPRASRHKKPLVAGARSSCCGKSTPKRNCSYRLLFRPTRLHR